MNNIGDIVAKAPFTKKVTTQYKLFIQSVSHLFPPFYQIGKVRLGDTVRVGFVSQSRDSLDPTRTVFEEISNGEETIDINVRNSYAYGPSRTVFEEMFSHYCLFLFVLVYSICAFVHDPTRTAYEGNSIDINARYYSLTVVVYFRLVYSVCQDLYYHLT